MQLPFNLQTKQITLPNGLIGIIIVAAIYVLNNLDLSTLPLPAWETKILGTLIGAALLILNFIQKQETGNGNGPGPDPNSQIQVFGAKTLLYCVEDAQYVSDYEYAPHKQNAPTHHIVPLKEWIPPTQKIGYAQPPNIKNVPGVVIDLRPVYFGAGATIKDQGKIGNCTSMTGSEDTALVATKLGYYGPNRQLPAGGYSAAYLYAKIRHDENTFPNDAGGQPVDVGAMLAYFGICFEKDFPTSQTECYDDPGRAQDQLAKTWVWNPNQAPLDPNHIAICLEAALEQPQTGAPRIGFPVGRSFLNAVTNGGYVQTPPSFDPLLGGHEMLVVGKDDNLVFPNGEKGAFICLQSWGNVGAPILPGSQQLGIFYISYGFFTSPFVMSHGGTWNYQQDAAFKSEPPNPPSPNTIQHTYTSSGTFTATVTVTDAQGNKQTGTVQITATGAPPPPPPPPNTLQVSVSASPQTGQAPFTTTLTANVSGGTGPYSYSWTFGD